MDGTEKVSIDPASTVSLCDTMEAPGQGPGGGKPQLSGNEYDQPGQSALHVGNSADLDPFSRASKVPRTPPDTQKVAPIFMGSNLGKRKADVSETGTISGSAAKKNRVEYETRLMVEIKKLNEFILAQPKIKTEIKDTAAKLVPLVRLAFIEAHRHCRNERGRNADRNSGGDESGKHPKGLLYATSRRARRFGLARLYLRGN